jgi:hypothetical protein
LHDRPNTLLLNVTKPQIKLPYDFAKFVKEIPEVERKESEELAFYKAWS